MSNKFGIGINTAKDLLVNPPAQFAHTRLVFAPFAVRVGDLDFPIAVWTDFAGVHLFRWYREVWRLSNRDTRAARLTFWHTYEIWLRRTRGPWWRLSLVERQPKEQKIVHERLVIPEVVESALLTAIGKLLTGVRAAGVWGEDCEAVHNLLYGPESYLDDLESGKIALPSFDSGHISAAAQPRKLVGPPSAPQAAEPPHLGTSASTNPETPPAVASRLSSPLLPAASTNIESGRLSVPQVPGAPQPSQEEILLRIALTGVEGSLSHLCSPLNQDLANSLVRQWLTNGGKAGLVTSTHSLWFRVSRKGSGYHLTCDKEPSQLSDHLRQFGVNEGEIPELLHLLNLYQLVACRAADGTHLRLRLDANNRCCFIEMGT